MSKFKFKFNKKSIILDIDENKKWQQHTGWLSVACYAHEEIMTSPIFDDVDKSRIKTLTLFSLYKHLKKL